MPLVNLKMKMVFHEVLPPCSDWIEDPRFENSPQFINQVLWETTVYWGGLWAKVMEKGGLIL